MIGELLTSVLVPVIAIALKYVLGFIGVEIDEVLFDTIVSAIVVTLLALFGYKVAREKSPAYFMPK